MNNTIDYTEEMQKIQIVRHTRIAKRLNYMEFIEIDCLKRSVETVTGNNPQARELVLEIEKAIRALRVVLDDVLLKQDPGLKPEHKDGLRDLYYSKTSLPEPKDTYLPE